MTEKTTATAKAEPKKYIVEKNFFDGEDGGKLYEAGHQFPKPANKKVSQERINALMNHSKGPFIREV